MNRSQIMLSTQRGATLIVALIFVLIMTLVGLAAIRGSGMQEMMAGNMRQLQLSFQAAEAGLRLGESLVDVSLADAQLPAFNGANGAFTDLNKPGVAHGPVFSWADATWGNGSGVNINDAINLPASPRYVLESIAIPVGLESVAMGNAIDHQSMDSLEEGRVYRITSRYSDNGNSGDVVLQSLYKR